MAKEFNLIQGLSVDHNSFAAEKCWIVKHCDIFCQFDPKFLDFEQLSTVDLSFRVAFLLHR